MNKIYLFGKIISKSKLKYTISPKLKIYIHFVIETISKDRFDCIIFENKCDTLRNINLGNYVYVEGFGIMDKGKVKICINQMCF